MNSRRRDLYKADTKFQVDSITMSYLESLHFDFVGYEHIIKNLLLKHKDNPNYTYNKETCDIFIKKYINISKKYNLLKSELIKEYVPFELQNENFIFDFESECIVLDKKSESEGECCGCK